MQRLGLQSEPVRQVDGKGKDLDKAVLRETLYRNGATEAEADFLLTDENGKDRTGYGKRVELNAMTSAQFVALVEAALIANDVGKVIPADDRLGEAYRLFERGERIRRTFEAAVTGMSAQDIAVPADLGERVRAYLQEHPTASWDEAVAAIINEN